MRHHLGSFLSLPRVGLFAHRALLRADEDGSVSRFLSGCLTGVGGVRSWKDGSCQADHAVHCRGLWRGGVGGRDRRDQGHGPRYEPAAREFWVCKDAAERQQFETRTCPSPAALITISSQTDSTSFIRLFQSDRESTSRSCSTRAASRSERRSPTTCSRRVGSSSRLRTSETSTSSTSSPREHRQRSEVRPPTPPLCSLFERMTS